MIKVLQD